MALAADLHLWAAGLARHDWLTPPSVLPTDGIYLFFETGETGEAVDLGGSTLDRIVRVGTHRVDGRFRQRIRQHYGNVGSLGGNKNGSVFRKHVGGALLYQRDANDPRLAEWIAQGGHSYPEVEEEVSCTLRDRFTFCAIPVAERAERLVLESGLIALLAQHSLERPSATWLGAFAADPAIRASGLWNTQHVHPAPLSADQFNRLQRLAEEKR